MKPLLPILLLAVLTFSFAMACSPDEPLSPANVESFPAGNFPRALAFDGHHVWVVNLTSNSVSKITREGQTVGEYPAGTLPQSIVFDGENLWVGTSIGEVIKLSTEGETLLRVELEGILNSAEFDGCSIWVADTLDGAITKIGLTGQIEATSQVGVKPSDLLYDGSHIWVANGGDDTILKLDENGQVLLTVNAEQPGALAFDGKNLWTTNTGFLYYPGSTVTKFDTNGQRLGVYLVGSSPGGILYADGVIWVASELNGFNITGSTITKLSPDGENLGGYHAGSGPQSLLYDGDHLWAVDRVTATVSRMNADGLPHVPPQEQTNLAVERDPAYPRGLSGSGINPNHDIHPWLTDFSIHSVPYEEISPGGPGRDEITPIDNPSFVSPTEADQSLHDAEPVLLLDLNSDPRAYPLRFLLWHEIVNDVVGGVPVVVTYCPLCNSAIVLNRTLDGTVYDFGTTGYLRYLDLIMWDRQTESWWQQFTGEAIIGELTGRRLEFIPTGIVPWAQFRESHPDGKVLSLVAGYARPYGQSPYQDIDSITATSPREASSNGANLPSMERVVGVTIEDTAVAFDYATLTHERVVNRTINGTDLVIFYEPKTLSPLQNLNSGGGVRAVGATGVFSSHVNGQKLTFKFDNGAIVDEETGSHWNLLGHAAQGPLTGQKLTPILHTDLFWFAWLAFNPTTHVYTPTP